MYFGVQTRRACRLVGLRYVDLTIFLTHLALDEFNSFTSSLGLARIHRPIVGGSVPYVIPKAKDTAH